MERDRLPQALRCVHFPQQPRRLGMGANPSGWLPLHRHLALPLLDRRRFHALGQIPVHLTGGVDPSRKLVLQLRRPYPLLRRNFRPLRREVLVAEPNSLNQPPHRGLSPFRPVCVSSLPVGAWLSSSFSRASLVCRPCQRCIGVGGSAIDGGAIVDDWRSAQAQTLYLAVLSAQALISVFHISPLYVRNTSALYG